MLVGRPVKVGKRVLQKEQHPEPEKVVPDKPGPETPAGDPESRAKFTPLEK
jgi:hypothetical protein